jgi:hypothetical protein
LQSYGRDCSAYAPSLKMAKAIHSEKMLWTALVANLGSDWRGAITRGHGALQ